MPLWEGKKYQASWLKLWASLKQATIWVRCICNSWSYELGTVAETTEREITSRILVPALKKCRNPIYTHRATASTLFQIEIFKNEYLIVVRTFLPIKGVCRSSKYPHPYSCSNPCDIYGESRGNSHWCLVYRCLETGTNCSLQWAALRAVWLVITHKPWCLTLWSDSWTVLKGLTLWFGWWKAKV